MVWCDRWTGQHHGLLTYLICKGKVGRWFACFLIVVVCSTSDNVSCFPGIYSFRESKMLIQECSLCYLDAPCTLGANQATLSVKKTIWSIPHSWGQYSVGESLGLLGACWSWAEAIFRVFPYQMTRTWSIGLGCSVLVTYLLMIFDWYGFSEIPMWSRHVWYFNKGSSLDSIVYSLQ